MRHRPRNSLSSTSRLPFENINWVQLAVSARVLTLADQTASTTKKSSCSFCRADAGVHVRQNQLLAGPDECKRPASLLVASRHAQSERHHDPAPREGSTGVLLRLATSAEMTRFVLTRATCALPHLFPDIVLLDPPLEACKRVPDRRGATARETSRLNQSSAPARPLALTCATLGYPGATSPQPTRPMHPLHDAPRLTRLILCRPRAAWPCPRT